MHTNNYSSTVFFPLRFPHKPGDIEKWIEAIRIQIGDYKWVPSEGNRVCSNHFHQEHTYQTASGFRRLRCNALPVFLVIIFFSLLV